MFMLYFAFDSDIRNANRKRIDLLNKQNQDIEFYHRELMCPTGQSIDKYRHKILAYRKRFRLQRGKEENEIKQRMHLSQ